MIFKYSQTWVNDHLSIATAILKSLFELLLLKRSLNNDHLSTTVTIFVHSLYLFYYFHLVKNTIYWKMASLLMLLWTKEAKRTPISNNRWHVPVYCTESKTVFKYFPLYYFYRNECLKSPTRQYFQSTITIDDPLDMKELKRSLLFDLPWRVLKLALGTSFLSSKILFAIEWRNEIVIGNG